ncbi:MAG: hypothetical protein ACREJP_05380, partial [Candidatus Methylomirabilales bacterium]
DCDVIVKGDPSPFVPTTTVRVRPALENPFSEPVWERLYDGLGLARPRTDCVMAVSGEKSYPYYNTGVLFVGREACLPLLDSWNMARDRVLELDRAQPTLLVDKNRVVSKRRADQPSFPLALAAANLEAQPLPFSLNMPTRVPRFAPEYEGWGPPFILHYHRAIDSLGFLLGSPHPRINRELDEFNRCRAEALGIPYDGLAVPSPWDRIKQRPSYWTARRTARRWRRRALHAATPAPLRSRLR